jgi:hypothetical protein
LTQKEARVRTLRPRDDLVGLKPDMRDASRNTSYNRQHGCDAIEGGTLGERGDDVEKARLGHVKGLEEGYKRRRRPRVTERKGQNSEYFFLETYLRLEYYFASISLLRPPSPCQYLSQVHTFRTLFIPH